MAIHFGFDPNCILNPFYVSNPMDDSIMAKGVYRSCVISVHGREILMNLIEWDMVVFDVILRMD